MLYKNLFILVFAFSLFNLTGCSSDETKDEQTITIQRLVTDHTYKDYREITNQEKVQTVKSVMKEDSWEQAKVEMVRPADYRFVFEYSYSHIEEKPVLYEMWISPNQKQVELLRESLNTYN